MWGEATIILRQPILPAFAASALGILLAAGWDAPSWALAGLALALVVLWRAERARHGVVLASLVGFVGVGWVAASHHDVPSPISVPCSEASDELVYRFRIVGPASRAVASDGGRVQQRATARLRHVRCAGKWKPVAGRVRLTLSGGAPLRRGDLLEARLTLNRRARRRNPSQPDPRAWMRRAQVSGWARGDSGFAVLESGGSLWAGLDRARGRVARLFEARLPAASAAVAKALALGDRASIQTEQREAWAAAGIAHLLAISGLHVGLVAAALYLLLRWSLGTVPGLIERVSARRLAAALCIPAVGLFCAWVGAPVSALRASVMAGVYFAAIVLGRPHSAANALAVAGLSMLLIWPTSVYDVGFLLSFGAVMALLFWPRVPLPAGRRWWHWALGSMAASAAVSLVTAPVVAHAFGRIAWISPLSNLVAVPVATLLLTPASLLLAGVGLVVPQLAAAALPGLGGGIAALDTLARWLAPFGALAVPQPNAVEVTAYLAGLISVGVAVQLSAPPHRRRMWLLASICALVLIASAGWRLVERFDSGRLSVVMPYVGHGDGMVLIFPRGTVMVVDGAGSYFDGWDPGRAIMAPLLRRLGIRTIDVAVVTHAHPDHVNGFDYLSRHFTIESLWWSGAGADVHALARLRQRILRAGGEVHTAAALPERLRIDGVEVDVLHPRPREQSLSHYPELGLNDNSVVLRLRYGARSLLLTGDIERPAERLLPADIGHVDVLKIPHHGSNTSSSAHLLDRIEPDLGFVSCGHDSRFGFPDTAVLERLRQRSIPLLRTDRHGQLRLETDGRHWWAQGMVGRMWRCGVGDCVPLRGAL